MNRLTGSHRPKLYCHDCDAETQAEMLAEGRCEHPEVVFVPVSHWSLGGEVEVIGIVPTTKKHAPLKYRVPEPAE